MITLDNAIGMFMGLAIGDAFGAPLEFTQAREPDSYITKYASGGAHDVAVGEWTDDTSMALALAKSLIENKGEFNPNSVMDNFCEWYLNGKYSPREKCFDIGYTTQKALNRYLKNKEVPYQGTGDDEESGNGGLMRLAPVVMVSATPERAMEVAVAQSILTHGSAKCLNYSRIFAHELWHGDALRRYRNYRHPLDIDRKQVMSGGYIVETYQAAMWAFCTTNNFGDCLIRAVNRGYDSDTVGAVAGMIAGAHYGKSGIPKYFLDNLMWRDELQKTAIKLYQLRA